MARGCWLVGARERPTSTPRSTRGTSTRICARGRRWRRSSRRSATWRSGISRGRSQSSILSAAGHWSALRMTAEGRARRRDSWRVYRLQLALGAAGLAACGLVLAAGVQSVHVHAAGAHRVDVGGLRLTYPAVNAAAVLLLALAALGAAVLVVAVRAAWWQGRAQRRMLRALPLAGALTDHPAVFVVDVAAPLAFCAGWLRPRVYVSA